MIRLAPWDVVANAFATRYGHARATPTFGRFAAPERGLPFWLALWALAIAAEFGALAPVIFRARSTSRRCRSSTGSSEARSRHAG
jgi:hypothetical protein